MAFSTCTTLSQMAKTIKDLRDCGLNIVKQNNKYYIKIENVLVEVTEYDTVWTIRHKVQQEKLKKQGSRYDKEIKEGQAEVKKQCEIFDKALELIRALRRQINQLLRNNEAKFLSELTGESYEQGVALRKEKADATTQKNSALAATQDAAHKTVGACCNKILYG